MRAKIRKTKPTNHYVKKPKNRVCLFIPLTRDWRIDTMANQAERLLQVGFEITGIAIVIDSTLISEKAVIARFSQIPWLKPSQLVVFHTQLKPATENNIGERRGRITNTFDTARKILPDCDYVFTIEDDTNIKENTLSTLFKNYRDLESIDILHHKVGIVSGVQAGRWGYKMIGAWKANNYEAPSEVETLPYCTSGIQPIGAAGFYCYLTTRNLFVNCKYRFNNFGPDVNYGFDISARGYTNYINWDVVTGHVTRGRIILPDSRCIVVKYRYNGTQWKQVLPAPKTTLYI